MSLTEREVGERILYGIGTRKNHHISRTDLELADCEIRGNVQDSRRRIWIDAQTRKWGSFEELNAWLGARCRALCPAHRSSGTPA